MQLMRMGKGRGGVAAGMLGLMLGMVSCVDPGVMGPPLANDGDGSADVIPAGGSTGGSSGSTTGGSQANPDVSDPCIQVGQPASPNHREMFEALNRYRLSKGLATLSYSKVLEKAADAQAVDMYRRNFFDHTNPDGDGPADRAADAGFCRSWIVGENLAWNQQSVAEVQVAWQNSPGHNANMINANFRYVGMGYYFSANGPYYVQVFGNVFPQ